MRANHGNSPSQCVHNLPRFEAEETSLMTTLSVLICTYNRHNTLRRALEALINQTIEKPDQVVVVNGGDEQADLVIHSFDGQHGVEVTPIKTVNVNLATSRNVGLPHCTGDIVAMTDDDAEVFPDWVAQMKRGHAEYLDAGAVGGAIIGTASDRSLISRLADVATFPSPAEPAYVRTLPGVNISYKREVMDCLGPQDETLFRGEDVDYNWRAKRLGYEILYHPAIKVRHHHRPNLKQFLYQHYMYGRAYYLVRHKWTDMYCVYPHRLRRAADFLKMLNFVCGVFYQPFLFTTRLLRISDWVPGYAVLWLNGLVWRIGIIRQAMIARELKFQEEKQSEPG